MKVVIVLLSIILSSCAPKINITPPASPTIVSTFEQECYQEYLTEFNRLNKLEKEFVLYFEMRILKRYKDYQWISCGENLNSNQRDIMAKWWGLQGLLNTSLERRQTYTFVYQLIVSMGTSKTEAKEFIYAITERDVFENYKLNMCAYNRRNYK
jgi:hypothetical protein